MKRNTLLVILIGVLLLMGAFTINVNGTKIINGKKTLDVKYENLDFTVGQYLFVGGQGPGNYTLIQDAIDNATIGDTVYVYDNVYHESILIDKSINLIGESIENTIIDGDFVGNVVTFSSNEIFMSNFTVKNSLKYLNENCVILIQSSGNRISNCMIVCDDSAQNEIAFRISPGFNNNEIVDNQIYNCDIGFDIQSSNNKVIGNIIRDCGCDSVWIHTNIASGYGAKNNTVSGNNIYEIGGKIGWGYGIWIHYSVGNKIVGNSISGKYCGIHIEVRSDHTIVKNNEIFNNRGYAIGISTSSNCNISSNSISKNEDFGIGIVNAPNHDNIIYHNNFVDNRLNAFTRDCDDVKWVGNYWDDWIGLRFIRLDFLPYWIPKGTRLNGMIKIRNLSPNNFDWNPAKEPYDI